MNQYLFILIDYFSEGKEHKLWTCLYQVKDEGLNYDELRHYHQAVSGKLPVVNVMKIEVHFFIEMQVNWIIKLGHYFEVLQQKENKW